MPRFTTLSIAMLLAVPAATASAQGAQAPVRVTTTAVARTTLFKILPGQGGAYNRDLVDHLIPIYEEYKKAGIIVDYSLFSKTTTESADDWGVGVTLVYANFAALDNMAAKTDPITLKHYGSAEARAAAGNARGAIRTVVQSLITQRLSYTR